MARPGPGPGWEEPKGETLEEARARAELESSPAGAALRQTSRPPTIREEIAEIRRLLGQLAERVSTLETTHQEEMVRAGELEARVTRLAAELG